MKTDRLYALTLYLLNHSWTSTSELAGCFSFYMENYDIQMSGVV